MASELADVANIAPGIQRCGCRGMSQAMRPHGPAYPRRNAQPADKLPDRLP